jgi:hypothetical protein
MDRAGEYREELVMINHIREASPRLKARAAGVFYLLSVLTAIYAEVFIRGKLL